MNNMYKIVRFTFEDDDPENLRVIKRGLTLSQAETYCRHPATKGITKSGSSYFDGYKEDRDVLDIHPAYNEETS
jgi:hypothetical protein